MARNHRAQIILTPAQLTRLTTIAHREGFTGGAGKLADEPNLARTLQWCLAQADEQLGQNAPATTWARR